MQTFLPYDDFTLSARALDNRRLNKQITEVWQIYRTLIGLSDGWQHHPAVRMWCGGYHRALLEYGRVCGHEWADRWLDGRRGGHAEHAAAEKIVQEIVGVWSAYSTRPLLLPSWFGDEAFHASHRSNLLRKNPEWYGQFGWTEPHDLPYVWPVTKGDEDE